MPRNSEKLCSCFSRRLWQLWKLFSLISRCLGRHQSTQRMGLLASLLTGDVAQLSDSTPVLRAFFLKECFPSLTCLLGERPWNAWDSKVGGEQSSGNSQFQLSAGFRAKSSERRRGFSLLLILDHRQIQQSKYKRPCGVKWERKLVVSTCFHLELE